MRHHSYLNTAIKAIESYKGETPLSHYLRQFFATEKKYGSKDRKQIAALCYNYYRLGKAAKNIAIEERIMLATFLCEHSSSEFLAFHRPDWNEKITLPTPEKLLIINQAAGHADHQLLEIFPWTGELSEGIIKEQFAASFLLQPDLFVRIRPGKKDIVLKKLEAAAVDVRRIREDCLTFPNSTKIDSILEIDREVVIQDSNSQKVLDFLKESHHPPLGRIQIWDCCAASGGKSILAYDILNGNVELTVSDIRESILLNLKKRFATAGITTYNSFLVDLQTAHYPLPTTNYQLLLCDAPCTGSGTWARTPEQLYFFDPGLIDVYAQRQKNIVSNAIQHLQKGGLFIYITCSVFKKENEGIVDFIKESFRLKVRQMDTIKGYEEKADSMFVAVFKKD